MIEILPMKNQEKEAEILKAHQNLSQNARVLEMTEGENSLGYVVVDLLNSNLLIHEFALANNCNFNNLDMESGFFLDTLMRSAASWGETKGAKTIETSTATYNAFLSKKGFDTDIEHAFTKMSTIVHYTPKPAI